MSPTYSHLCQLISNGAQRGSGDLLEKVDRKIAQIVEGVGPIPVHHFGEFRFQGIEDPLDHGVEKVGLVPEVPIDRTPRHPRRHRDLGQ